MSKFGDIMKKPFILAICGLIVLFVSVSCADEEPSSFAPRQEVLSLHDCIDIAAENNLLLEIEAQKIKLAELKLGISYRDFFPQIKLKCSENEGELNELDWKGKYYHIEGRQPVFHGGEIFYSNRQAKEFLAAAVAESRRIEADIVYKVSEEYFKFLARTEMLNQSEKTKDEVSSFLGNIKRGYDEGIIAKIDLFGVEYYYNEIAHLALMTLKDLKETEYDLKAIMNIDAKEEIEIRQYVLNFKNPVLGDKVEPVNLINSLPFNIPELSDCMETAFNNRQEIVEFNHRLKAESYRVKVEKAKNYPYVDLVGSIGKAGEAYEINRFKTSDEWFVGIELKWNFGGSMVSYSFNEAKNAPRISTIQSTGSRGHRAEVGILDNLKIFSDRKEAEISEIERRYELDEVVKRIYKETTSAYYNLCRAAANVVLGSTGLKYKEQSYEIAEFRYKQNQIGASDLIEKKIELNSAKIKQKQSVSEYFTSVAYLNRAVGKTNYLNLLELIKGEVN